MPHKILLIFIIISIASCTKLKVESPYQTIQIKMEDFGTTEFLHFPLPDTSTRNDSTFLIF